MNFWETTPLQEMDETQWEALCDGCAKCCLHSFIDSDYDDEADGFTGLREGERLVFSSISCAYLDSNTCQCIDYKNRLNNVPSCVKLDKNNIEQAYFMPPSCAYRRILEGRGLASWHPLLNNGSREKMDAMELSAKGKVTNEQSIDMDDFEDYLVEWPMKDQD
ncbi:conserved protein of unknown function; putative YcgN protein [Pseudoalteromonas luteoviolacea B = ATCC 29581]|nr:conserved protein of unknown function; putative YcgN protein [Pseudoalteromonas luteoviolacea B = ATCC 29581]